MPPLQRLIEFSQASDVGSIPIARSRNLVDSIAPTQVETGEPGLPNDNSDTGAVTEPGKHRLKDDAHARPLDAPAKQNFSNASPELRAEILEIYGHPDARYATKWNPRAWAKV